MKNKFSKSSKTAALISKEKMRDPKASSLVIPTLAIRALIYISNPEKDPNLTGRSRESLSSI